VPDDPLLARVLRARQRIREQEADLTEARREFRAALVAAHQGGHSYAAIGRALGVSRQRVAEMIQEET
jgi:DNA-directed RNA polymerase specialized sigma24 family protein